MSNRNPVQIVPAEDLHKYRKPENMSRTGPRSNMAKRAGLYAAKSGSVATTRKVSRLSNKVFAELSWLTAADESLVRSWATLSILAAEMFAYIDIHGLIDEKTDTVTRLLDQYRLTKIQTHKLEQSLEMSPVSRAALGVDVARGRALDLAAEIAEARQTEGGQS